eukprot:g28693.t1
MASSQGPSVSFGEMMAKARDLRKADVPEEEKKKVKKEKVAKARAAPKKDDKAKSAKAVKKEKKSKGPKGLKAKSAKEAKAKAKAKAKVKKELKVKAKAKDSKPKAKPKAKAKIKLKLEKVRSSIQKRREEKVAKESQSRGASKREDQTSLDWCKRFYKFQSTFIDQVVESDWEVCFGALGSGLVGVRFLHKALPETQAPPAVGEGLENVPEHLVCSFFDTAAKA